MRAALALAALVVACGPATTGAPAQTPAPAPMPMPVPMNMPMPAGTAAHIAISCGDTTQAAFDRGLTFLHNMDYVRARDTFTKATADNAPCAMLWWGVAMTYFQPVWSGQPTAEALAAGAAAVDKAHAATVANDTERAWVAAVAAYFDDYAHNDHDARLHHWAAAQADLAQHRADDVEAQAFWALSRLATLDKRDHKKADADALAIAEQLEALLHAHPGHPGLMHYLLHAYDNPALAARGVDIAKLYADNSPDAAHALHMPSHIFVRLGDWNRAIDSNLKSAAAALKHPAANNRVSRDFLHATDYLTYAYLQLGDDERAAQAVAKIDATADYERSNGPASYALAASPARLALERQRWADAAALVPRAVPYDWEHYPWSEAVTFAARGLGAARSGNAAAAQTAVAELERLEPLVESKWWKARVHIDHDVVAGWIAHDRSDDRAAEALLRGAATAESAAGKDNVEPGHVIAANEQLGDLLLELKHPEQALEAYKAALDQSPQRLAALYGAGLAAERAGKLEDATTYYKQLVHNTGSSPRPACVHAREFLAQRH